MAAAVRERVAQFQEAGIGGVDLYLASFGPSLQVFSENGPLRRGRPTQKPCELALFPDEEFDPYAVWPEDALDAARRERSQMVLQPPRLPQAGTHAETAPGQARPRALHARRPEHGRMPGADDRPGAKGGGSAAVRARDARHRGQPGRRREPRSHPRRRRQGVAAPIEHEILFQLAADIDDLPARKEVFSGGDQTYRIRWVPKVEQATRLEVALVPSKS